MDRLGADYAFEHLRDIQASLWLALESAEAAAFIPDHDHQITRDCLATLAPREITAKVNRMMDTLREIEATIRDMGEQAHADRLHWQRFGTRESQDPMHIAERNYHMTDYS